MTGKAAIYVRVSTAKQAESDLSIPDQIAQCQKWCEQRGWKVVEVFCEPGASALDEDRPVFQEMIFKATRSDHPFDHVIVHSLSRFSRDSLHSELYVRQLRKAGVELISITQDIGHDASGETYRKLLNIFDEHQSRENAKHVHRAMLENTRQGFWNGSRPPFGYGVVVKEVRGSKEKKVLAVNEDEARVVREIFDLAVGERGRSIGVKAIATHLNERGVKRRGVRFSTGSVYGILTCTAYRGQHYFNQYDSRNKKPRPPSQWIELAVPVIVDEQTFNAVQGLLKSRNARCTPPRVVNGRTLLAGVARCGYCNAALTLNTGKGGAYRYYCCSRKTKEGPLSCRGIRIPMDRLDNIVVDEVLARVVEPTRLHALLSAYLQTANERVDRNKKELAKLKHAHSDAQAGLSNLLSLVEKGLMEAGDPVLKERLLGLKLQRDELATEIAHVQQRIVSGEPEITPEKLAHFAALLRDKLTKGDPNFRKAYARLVMREVSVKDREIRISGSKAILARAASQALGKRSPEVLSFVREWRPLGESNPSFKIENLAS